MRSRAAMSAFATLVAAATVFGPAPGAPAATPPTISIGDGAGDESNGGKPGQIRMPITLSDPATTTVTVAWRLVATGTASIGDVATTSGTVTFKPSARTGQTAVTKYLTVRAVPDAIPEGPESFEVRLSMPTSGHVLARAVGAGTIHDPPASATIAARDASVVEGDTGARNVIKVPITLGSTSPGPVTVDVAVVGGTATQAVDYVPLRPRTVVFAPGQTRKAVAIAVLPESGDEAPESIVLSIANPTGGPTVATPSVTATILDVDGPPPPPEMVVDTANDTHDTVPGDGRCTDSSGACSLRAAVDEINTGAVAPVVRLAADPVLSLLGAGEDANAGGDIDIRVDGIDIFGDGHTIDANHIDRAIHARHNIELTDVRITGGDAPEIGTTRETFGGAVFTASGLVRGTRVVAHDNRAYGEFPASCSPACPPNTFGAGGAIHGIDVWLVESELTDNVAGQSGGAISAQSDTTIERSTIRGNQAGSPGRGGLGGGINARSVTVSDSSILGNTAHDLGGGIRTGDLRMERTLVSGNQAQTGGGVHTGASSRDRILDSTFDGNSGDGAAIAMRANSSPGTAPLISGSTITNNAGGASVSLGQLVVCGPFSCPLPPTPTLTVQRSIIMPASGQVGCAIPPPDPSFVFGWIGQFVDGGANLITAGGSCAFGGTSDPLLGPLAANGGPTWTRLPGTGSPAIDGGGTCIGTDQRGVNRPQGTACDIGAVEVAA